MGHLFCSLKDAIYFSAGLSLLGKDSFQFGRMGVKSILRCGGILGLDSCCFWGMFGMIAGFVDICLVVCGFSIYRGL